VLNHIFSEQKGSDLNYFWQFFKINVSILTLASYSLVAFAQASAATTVVTNHNDPARTGANSAESVLTQSNVAPGQFGKLFSLPVDGVIYAQPLFVEGINIPGQGIHNVLYVVTQNNSVFALDADGNSTQPFWTKNLGNAVWTSQIPGDNRDILGRVGILSTPVIDLKVQVIYVVAETYENNGFVFRLHALSLTNGAEKYNGPVTIGGSYTDSPGGAGMVTFDPAMHWQRTALLEANGNIYVAFGSHQDTPPYHGWIFGYDARSLRTVTIKCLTPNGSEGGIWQSGAGLIADSVGYVYGVTGNGTFNPSPLAQGGFKGDFGESFLKMNPLNNLLVSDYFTPFDHDYLDSIDADLGSAGPLLIPGTTYLVGGGKEGIIYLVDTNNMGKSQPSSDAVLQSWQNNSALFSSNVFSNSHLYVSGRGDVIKSYLFNPSPTDGRSYFSLSSFTPFAIPRGYSNESAMSASSNGNTPGTGILWVTYSTTGGSNGAQYPGILRALSADNVSVELWNSEMDHGHDGGWSWSKWTPPTIANGKVYLSTFDNSVIVFGQLPASK
jgi:hypothetical protein